jgi:hypothetical protein
MSTQPLPDPDWKEAARLTQQLQRSEVLRAVVSEAQDYGLAFIQVDREEAELWPNLGDGRLQAAAA